MPIPEEIYDQQMLNGDNLPTNIYMQTPAPQKQSKISFNNCQVLLKQSSKLNKKIIEFFKLNLTELNKSGYVFEWISVNEEEIEFYTEQDIDKFPSIVIDNNVVSGISSIISILKGFINKKPQNKQVNKQKKPIINNESDIKEFLMNEINKNDDEEDEVETQQTNMHKRATEMMSKRSSMGLENPNGSSEDNSEEYNNINKPNNSNQSNNDNVITSDSTLNTVNLIKKTGVKDDDDMLDAFWGNQELTEL